jgi:electron transfer flavoprotein alpha subunit
MILVFAEQKDGKLNRASWEAIAAAQVLAREVGDADVQIAVLGKGVGAVATELSGAAVNGVVAVDNDALANYTPDAFVQATEQLVSQHSPTFVVFPHTYQTRDFVPALAATIDRALVTDVIGIRKVNGVTAFARPMFQGKLTADVAPEGPAPHLVTFQIGAFRADAVERGSSSASVTTATVNVDASKVRQQAEAPFQEAKQAVDRRTPRSSPAGSATTPPPTPASARASRASAGRGSSRRSCPPWSTGWSACRTRRRWRRCAGARR